MKRKKRKLKIGKIISIFLFIILILVLAYFFLNKEKSLKQELMPKLSDITEVNTITTKYELKANITYEHNDEIEKDKVISQSIKEGSEITKGSNIDIVISLGKLDKEKLASDNINELGKVPIMMYHGIREKTASSTGTTGGNVDKDGYNRTPEAFREDLEFYYEKGYRMVRLEDYIHGNVDVEYGKSPIILTFDDGNEDNIRVTGLDEDGNIIIDKNSAIGILEEFKKKHPDVPVTATFFVNGGIFNQEKYNEKIVKWMIENGYDIGNHTQTHLDIKKSTAENVQKEIVYVYNKLEELIPGKYVKIIALPFGSPYTKEHENYKYVLSSTYDGKTYETEAALRVGWEPEVSPYDKNSLTISSSNLILSSKVISSFSLAIYYSPTFIILLVTSPSFNLIVRVSFFLIFFILDNTLSSFLIIA